MNPIPAFDDAGLFETLLRLSADQLDSLPFGVIGFDARGHIVQ